MILTLLLAAASPMPTYANLPPDLAAAAREFDTAQVKADAAALGRALADDYVLVNSQGQEETKAQFIADYTAPGFTFEPFTIEQPVERVWADGAILGGVANARGMDGGKRYAIRLRFVDVWAKRNGRWQVIYTQATHALPKK